MFFADMRIHHVVPNAGTGELHHTHPAKGKAMPAVSFEAQGEDAGGAFYECARSLLHHVEGRFHKAVLKWERISRNPQMPQSIPVAFRGTGFSFHLRCAALSPLCSKAF